MPAIFPKRILIVEDDKTTLSLLRHRLEFCGFRVLTAETGAEALKRLSENTFDLVILDVKLPDMSGLDVCAEIRRVQGPWLAILMLTGMDRAMDQLNGFGHGADAYLTKPYRSDELIKTIQFLLGMENANSSKAKQYLSIDDVANSFGINQTTVYRLVQKGLLPGFKVGAQWRFSRESLESWIVRQKKGSVGKKEENHESKKENFNN